MFDAEGCATLFNERYTRMVGPSAALSKGQSLLDLFKQMKEIGSSRAIPKHLSRPSWRISVRENPAR